MGEAAPAAGEGPMAAAAEGTQTPAARMAVARASPALRRPVKRFRWPAKATPTAVRGPMAPAENFLFLGFSAVAPMAAARGQAAAAGRCGPLLRLCPHRYL